MPSLKKCQPLGQAGFTYLVILFGIAVLGVGLAAASEVWVTVSRRDKERELIYIGRQYREAIRSYYEQAAGIGKRYPDSLDDLLRDPRLVTVKRHLRKLFRDPITGDAKWGLVQAPTGGIMGIYSLSEEQPLKSANFEAAEETFEGKQHYSDWKFVYVPPILLPTPAKAASPKLLP